MPLIRFNVGEHITMTAEKSPADHLRDALRQKRADLEAEKRAQDERRKQSRQELDRFGAELRSIVLPVFQEAAEVFKEADYLPARVDDKAKPDRIANYPSIRLEVSYSRGKSLFLDAEGIPGPEGKRIVEFKLGGYTSKTLNSIDLPDLTPTMVWRIIDEFKDHFPSDPYSKA